MDLVVNIPESVSIHILTQWINVSEVCRLDTAYCNKSRRPILLGLLCTEKAVFDGMLGSIDLGNCFDQIDLLMNFEFALGWIQLRSIKLSVLYLPRNADDYQSAVCGILTHSTTHLNKVCCHCIDEFAWPSVAAMPIAIGQIASYCSTLQILEFYQCAIPPEPLGQILQQCQHLIELKLDHCRELMESSFLNVRNLGLEKISIRDSIVSSSAYMAAARACPSLQQLCIIEGTVREDSILGFARYCTNLSAIELDGAFVNITDNALEMVALHCPKLTCLKLRSDGSSYTDAGLQAIARGCTQLQQVCIHSGADVTDDAVLALVNNCKALRLVDLENSSVSDVGAMYVAQHVPYLTHLRLCGLDITNITLEAIAQHLFHLENLNISNCHNISDEGLISLILGEWAESSGSYSNSIIPVSPSSLPSLALHTLVLEKLGMTNKFLRTLATSTTRSCAIFRSSLTSINLYACVQVDEDGIVLLDGLPNLSHLIIDENKLSNGALYLWHRLRPCLQIEIWQ